MVELRKRLEDSRPILADGAMGTFLSQLGNDISICPENLNLSNPRALHEVAKAYHSAGAEILQTNTFGGSPIRLREYDLDSKTKEINRVAVESVRNIVGTSAYITGSIGPCGQHLLPFGDLDPESFKESCRLQMSALVEGGVDAFSIETVMDVEEAVLALQVAREAAPHVVRIVSAAFLKNPNGFFTSFGNSLRETVQRFYDEGAEVVGANCGEGMTGMIDIARELRSICTLPLIIRPNAGLPEVDNGITVWNEAPGEFAGGVKELLDVGIKIIGGCCGTTPEHIRKAKSVIDEHQH